jgi:hypothetical protein
VSARQGQGTERDWRSAAVAVVGGALIVAGTVLPWISLFAGLQRYPGISGQYGRLLFAGGVVLVAGGAIIFARPHTRLRIALGALGVGLAIFASWILVGLRATMREVGRNPFVIPRAGPGLFVCVAGGLVVAALLLPARRRIHKN